MSMFSKLREPRRRKEMDQREANCDAAIRSILQHFNCVLEPIMKADSHGMFAAAQIVALPRKDDDQRKPAQPEPAAGGAVTDRLRGVVDEIAKPSIAAAATASVKDENVAPSA